MRLVSSASTHLDKIDKRILLRPARAAIDAMLMIQPRSAPGIGSCFSICAMPYLQPKKTERAFTAMVLSHCSAVDSWMGNGVGTMPALLTNLKMVNVRELSPCMQPRDTKSSIHVQSTKLLHCRLDGGSHVFFVGNIGL